MALIPESIDAAVITSDENRRYFTGLKSSAGTLIVLKNKAYFIIDFRYIELAKKTITDFDVMLQQNNIFEQISAILADNNVKTVAVEAETMTVSTYNNYCDKLKDFTVTNTNEISKIITKLRAVKEQFEVDCLQKSQDITDLAFTNILNVIKPGMTETEIAIELEYSVKKAGAEGLGFGFIVVGGKNGSLPHGVPSDYVIQNGDMITMDFGSIYGGYVSDMTRTIAVGSINDEQKKIYDTVYNANMMALEVIKAGADCKAIDKLARDYIYGNGYEGCFGHGLGHSVGLNVHENPRFSVLSDDILEAGNVMTVEPGIYISGKFGVRIEDMVYVTNDGFINFTKSDKKLIIL